MTERRDPVDRVVDLVVAVPVSMTLAISRAVPAAWRAAQRRALPVVDAFADQAAEVTEVVEEAAEQAVGAIGAAAAEVDGSDAHGADVAPDAAVVEPEVGLTADELPIEEYDALAARQVVARLADLFPEELDAVERYEIAHRHRQTVLHRIAQLRA